MEGVGYVFSPTGTGRALSHRLPLARRVDLTTPRGREEAPIPPPDRLLTLIFPVYAHGVPGPLVRWLRQLPPGPGPVCLLAVYGSVSPGRALPQAARLLRRRGRTVVAAAQLPGPHCYDCLPGIPRLECRWEGLESFYRTALERAEGAAAPLHWAQAPHLPVPQRLMARLTAPPPSVDLEGCCGCNRCQGVCPVGAIGAHRGRCLRCAACVRQCPRGARSLRFYCRAPTRYISRHIKEIRAPRYF